MDTERTFFQYEDVKVTNSRFIVGSQTFALSNITSVKASEQTPNRFWPIALGILGALCAMGTARELGVVLLVVAGVWWFVQKAKFHVRLTTAGGETTALTSIQRDYIERVVQALNEAIVARG